MKDMFLYADHYEKNYGDGTSLLEATEAREENTKRLEFSSNDITIWAGTVSDTGDTINLMRLGQNPAGEKVILRKNTKAQHTTDADIHTATRVAGTPGGSLLFLGYQTKARMEIIPISADAKLSIMNRGKFSISGELDDFDFDIDPIALAKVIEDSIKKYTKSIQCCVVYGKIIGIMSKRYCPIPQNELVNTVTRILEKRYPSAEIIGGVISNRVSSVDYNLHEVVVENGVQVEIMTSLLNSDNGHSAVRLIPQCRPCNKHIVYPFYDDDWHSDHIAVTMEDVELGADTMFLKLRNNVALLTAAQNKVLNYPMQYAERAIERLNTLAKSKSGCQINENMKKDVLSSIDTFVTQGIITQFTVMDVADTIIDTIPTNVLQSTKDNFMKTIMRIIHIPHDEFDKIIP